MLDVTVQLPIHLAVIEFPRLRVDSSPNAWERLEACGATYRAAFGPDQPGSPGAVAGVEHARSLFRALGIDPTKRRPSSESLLRRALQGREMPRISNLVDAGNWCSLDFLLPLGLYDLARIAGGVVLERGAEAESYPAISNREINLAGRYLLADDAGPFGSPMTDSKRTAVTLETTSAVVFLYAPQDYDTDRLRGQSVQLAERVNGLCSGEGDAGIEIVSGS